MNDFERVTRLNQGLFPSPAREDVAISLDGNAVRGEVQVGQESLDVQTIGNFSSAAVDGYGHQDLVAPGGFPFERRVQRT